MNTSFYSVDPKTPRSSPWRVAYAESDDGVNWTKPNLGLVEYNTICSVL